MEDCDARIQAGTLALSEVASRVAAQISIQAMKALRVIQTA